MPVSNASPSDPILVDRLRTGDADALGVIVRQHRNPLIVYAEAIVRATDVAEEVVQETFVRLWENRARLRRGDALKAYLYRTARNLSLGEIRHSEVRRRTEAEVRLALHRPAPSALDNLVDEQCSEALIAAIATLPARRREALVLVRVEGLSLGEAADRMGLSRQTVANHVSLALRDLEEALWDYSP
jgi:RNA polymerase sigma-70 factor, ECF subfamily